MNRGEMREQSLLLLRLGKQIGSMTSEDVRPAFAS